MKNVLIEASVVGIKLLNIAANIFSFGIFPAFLSYRCLHFLNVSDRNKKW